MIAIAIMTIMVIIMLVDVLLHFNYMKAWNPVLKMIWHCNVKKIFEPDLLKEWDTQLNVLLYEFN